MRLTIAYSKIKKRNLLLINNDTYQRETLSEQPVRQPLRGYCTSGPYFLRPFAFSQKIKQLWTKKPMDLVTNVPRNSKITVLLQQRQLLWSYSEKCTKINILHVLNHKSITTWVSEIPVQLLGSLECYL